VEIDPADANSHAVVIASGAVIVQFAVAKGKTGEFSETMLMPEQ